MELVGRLARFPVELSVTTNGATLDHLARPLRDTGLHRVTISCGSPRADRFASITGRAALAQGIRGVDAVLGAGLDPVKLNPVLMRGIDDDDEVLELARRGRERGMHVRFIELMALGAARAWTMGGVVPAREVVERAGSVFLIEAAGQRGAEPAERYRYLEGASWVGVVASVTWPLCASCDRARLTAEGSLRSCLFSVHEMDLRALLRGGGSDNYLAGAIASAVARKWACHDVAKVDFVLPARSMSQIGG